MRYRLLSLLSDIENAIRCSMPEEDAAVLVTSRIVSYNSGLARLALRNRTMGGFTQRGQMELQHFHLADGTVCVKVFLSWAGSPVRREVDLFTIPGVKWDPEVQRIAEAWLDGPPPIPAQAEHPPMQATG
jgi:hypothetical protein